jgi:hypothetical protein
MIAPTRTCDKGRRSLRRARSATCQKQHVSKYQSRKARRATDAPHTIIRGTLGHPVGVKAGAGRIVGQLRTATRSRSFVHSLTGALAKWTRILPTSSPSAGEEFLLPARQHDVEVGGSSPLTSTDLIRDFGLSNH